MTPESSGLSLAAPRARTRRDATRRGGGGAVSRHFGRSGRPPPTGPGQVACRYETVLSLKVVSQELEPRPLGLGFMLAGWTAASHLTVPHREGPARARRTMVYETQKKVAKKSGQNSVVKKHRFQSYKLNLKLFKDIYRFKLLEALKYITRWVPFDVATILHLFFREAIGGAYKSFRCAFGAESLQQLMACISLYISMLHLLKVIKISLER